MPCSKCNSDFNLFNWKIKCGECEIKYCVKCLKKKDGVLYCEVCLILMSRPPDPLKLMELKVKELRDYLNRNNVSTYGLVEKKELVEMFSRCTIPEKQRKGIDKFTANFGDPLKPINGLLSNIESVLSDPKPSPRSPTTSPQHQQANRFPSEETSATPTASTSPPPQPTAAARQPQPPPPPPTLPPQEPPDNNDASESQPSQSPTTSREHTPESLKSVKIQPKIEDFGSLEELSQLSSRQLKILLGMNRVDYKGCLEKVELVEKAQRLWVDSNQNKAVATETIPSQELCKLCMDAPLDCVLLECGHITSCLDCGKKLAECPICRQYVVRVVRTFKA